jgi:PhoPQ-activated pathogenicity-related protein
MIQAKFGLNWPSALSGFRGEDFFKSLQTDDGRQVMVIAHTGELKRKQSPLTSNH